MKIVIALLGLWLANPVAGFAATPQQLTIGLDADAAEATRLPAYDPHAPVAVTVTVPGDRHADAVSITAAGPAGERVDLNLARTGGNRFEGVLPLGEPGRWALQVNARSGSLTTQTNAVALRVVEPPATAPWIGFAAGSGTFSLLGSAYLLVCRLARRARSDGRSAV